MIDVILAVFAVIVVLGIALTFHWIICRVKAKRCPACGRRWKTEVVGEWGGDEDWHCYRCGHAWIERY